MKILNLYAGIGGNRKLWGDDHEITSVELDTDIAKVYKDYFPGDTVIVGDAHEYLIEHYKEFDFIWASPPCPTHTRMNKNFNIVRYADMTLYQEIILLMTWFDGKYCVENVIPYYQPLIPAKQIGRNLFWCNFVINETNKANPQKEMKILAQKTKRKINNAKRWHKDGKLMNTTAKCTKFGFDLNGYEGKGAHKEKILNNLVNPETGLYILNCAMNIITKQNEKQTELF